MKKLTAIVLVLVLTLTLLTACGGGSSNSSGSKSNSSSSGNTGSSSSNTPSSDSSDSSTAATTSEDSDNENGSGGGGIAPEVIWATAVGGSGYDIFNAVARADDGYVAVGASSEESFGSGDWEGVSVKGFDNGKYEGADDGRREGDAIIAKFDANGDVVWKKNFGGAWADDFRAVCCDDDGCVAVGGPAHMYHGDWNWIQTDGWGSFIVKFDKNGDIVWKLPFSDGGGSLNSVIAVSDGYIVAGGSSASDWSRTKTNGRDDGIIAKFDKDGNLLWTNNFGGSEYDEFYSVIEVSDGFVAVGYSQGDSFGTGDWEEVAGKGDYDAIIVKFDTNGDLVWKQHFGGGGYDEFESVAQCIDGYVAVGLSNENSFENGDWDSISTNGENDAIIVKFDLNGNVVWKQHFGERYEDRFNAVIPEGDGFVVAGLIGSFTDSEAVILRIGANGNLTWEKRLGAFGRDYFNSLTEGIDGGYVTTIVISDTSYEYHDDYEKIVKKGGSDGVIMKLG